MVRFVYTLYLWLCVRQDNPTFDTSQISESKVLSDSIWILMRSECIRDYNKCKKNQFFSHVLV